MICECLHLIFMRINIERLMLYKINCLTLDRSVNIIMEILSDILAIVMHIATRKCSGNSYLPWQPLIGYAGGGILL